MKRSLLAIAVAVIACPALAQSIGNTLNEMKGRSIENIGERRFSRLYQGERVIGTFAVIQGPASGHGAFSTKIDSIDGVSVDNGNIAYEVIPGKHAVKVSCRGSDGVIVATSFTIFARHDYFYDVLSRPTGSSCTSRLIDGGRLHPNLAGVEVPPGEPSLTSATYYSMFERESTRHAEIWTDLTSAMYRFIAERYGCSTYSIQKVVWAPLAGKVHKDPNSDELKITGNFKESWTIDACGHKRKLEMRLVQHGNYGRYIFIKD